jgi:hypothetical protein
MAGLAVVGVLVWSVVVVVIGWVGILGTFSDILAKPVSLESLNIIISRFVVFVSRLAMIGQQQRRVVGTICTKAIAWLRDKGRTVRVDV